MKKKVFQKLKMLDELVAPVLFMTATFDVELLNFLQIMTGMVISRLNIFWGHSKSFQRRNITIKCEYATQPLRIMKNIIKNRMLGNSKDKMIIYGNVSKKLTKTQPKIEDLIDTDNNLDGDTVLIVGPMETELKLEYGKRFASSFEDSDDIEDTFNPRFLFGTPGCVGVRIDSENVKTVFRIRNSTSLLSLVQ